MSDNRPEWQSGANPAAGNDKASDGDQYATPSSEQSAHPGSTENESANPYSAYGQQPEAPSYGQQSAYPGSTENESANPYSAYGQQPEVPAYGQQAAYPGAADQQAQPYGQQAYPAYGQAPYPRPNPRQAMGIAGLITSFFFSVVGLVLSIVGLNQSRKAGMGNVPAVIGIIVGGLGTLVGILFFILIVMGIAAESGSSY